MMLAFTVRGMTPRPYSTEGVEEWRRRLVEAAKQLRVDGRRENPPQGTRFAVRIVFLMTSAHVVQQGAQQGPDLDNLAKPVLDSVFRGSGGADVGAQEQGLTGALIDADDKWVFSLRTEKREVPRGEHEGAVVIIEWETPLE